jgi:hypothetical protein
MAWNDITQFRKDITDSSDNSYSSFKTAHDNANYEHDAILLKQQESLSSSLIIVFSPNSNSVPKFVKEFPNYQISSGTNFSQNIIDYLDGTQNQLNYTDGTVSEKTSSWTGNDADILFIRDKSAKWYMNGIVTKVENVGSEEPTEHRQQLEAFALDVYYKYIDGYGNDGTGTNSKINIVGGHEGAGYGAFRFACALYDLMKDDNVSYDLNLFGYNFQTDLMSVPLEPYTGSQSDNSTLYDNMYPQPHNWNPNDEQFNLFDEENVFSSSATAPYGVSDFNYAWHSKYVLYPKLLEMVAKDWVNMYIGGGHTEEAITNETIDYSTPGGYNSYGLYRSEQMNVFGDIEDDGTITYSKVAYVSNLKNTFLQNILEYTGASSTE